MDADAGVEVDRRKALTTRGVNKIERSGSLMAAIRLAHFAGRILEMVSVPSGASCSVSVESRFCSSSMPNRLSPIAVSARMSRCGRSWCS